MTIETPNAPNANECIAIAEKIASGECSPVAGAMLILDFAHRRERSASASMAAQIIIAASNRL